MEDTEKTMYLDALLKAEALRVDQKIEAEVRRLDELAKLRAEHNVQLRIEEAKRLDAIRAVDVNAVHLANERAVAQASTLAKQVSESAETLRSLVQTTATSVSEQLAQVTKAIVDRIAIIEKTQYEGAGSKGGAKEMWGYIAGGIGIIIAIASFLLPQLK